jgi:hypothetical protein
MFTGFWRHESTSSVQGAFRDCADAGTEVRPVPHWIQFDAEHGTHRETRSGNTLLRDRAAPAISTPHLTYLPSMTLPSLSISFIGFHPARSQ